MVPPRGYKPAELICMTLLQNKAWLKPPGFLFYHFLYKFYSIRIQTVQKHVELCDTGMDKRRYGGPEIQKDFYT